MNDHPDGPLDRERETFLAALEKTSPDEREAFLDQACSSDAALRAQVEALLRHHAEDNFLEEPARGAGARAAVESTASEGPGTVIGRYKLLEKIGEGGYGVVYVAEQREPVRRRVALKVIKLGMDTRSVVARFEAERQALALMDHPHIAKVLDAGPTQTGRPYFVMEVVRGIKITDYCDQHQLSTLERLDLFMQVCRAVQHAHQKGIIHRDLKPSNILVAVNDGVAAPKVIDFGIAKATEGRLTDKTVYTELHQFLGTPAYMSPEQAEMTSVDIDTRSDIYSLGVLLYELLTSKTPFEHQDLLKAGLDTMRQTIRVKEPPRPSTRLSTLAAADLSTVARARRSEPPKLIHSVRGDLDWIVMKCLEKDRNRRYETANGLARDIERHLDHEPVNARPPSAVDRVQKIVRRHKPAFAAGLSLALVLTIGAAVSTTEAIRATRAERAQAGLTQKAEEAGRAALKNAEEAGRQARVASEQELLARRRFYAAEMNLAMQAWQAGDLPRTLELLETQRPAQGQSDLRSFEWFHLWNLANARLRTTLPGHAASVGGLAFSPDGKTLASCGWDSSIRFWDLPAGRQKEASRIHSSGLDQVAFTPDGSTLG
ncbi:MAG TPA: serine/threonine-protein kinase, partial [Dongiaceae bacterium]|nr:serine/threonine-protein kinase [Dongiaceae bacterium]